jgi:hypothetical protein
MNEPRRRRSATCPHLRLDGAPVLVGDLERYRKRSYRADLDLRRHDLRCLQRPRAPLSPDWANDVCLSSWARTCPFRAEPDAAARGACRGPA